MRLIADILGCDFQLNVISPDAVHTEEERVKPRKEAGDDAMPFEREVTIGELVDMEEAALEKTSVSEAAAGTREEEKELLKKGVRGYFKKEAVSRTSASDVSEAYEAADVSEACRGISKPEDTAASETVSDEAAASRGELNTDSVSQREQDKVSVSQREAETPLVSQGEAKTSSTMSQGETKNASGIRADTVTGDRSDGAEEENEAAGPKAGQDDGSPKSAAGSDTDESLKDEPVGDINPYTGKEYKSNSVRIHPKRIGYVQVYDAEQHTWADMTEWAFLGYQERKKALLGDEYEPPIYLD